MRKHKKELRCAIPTIKSDRFWLFGMSLAANLHLKLYLGAGTNFVESAPIDTGKAIIIREAKIFLPLLAG